MDSSVLTLDPAAIGRLHRIGGEELVRQMAQLFVQNASQRIAAAWEELEHRDFESIVKSMHALKSSAENIGADRLGQMAIRAESLADAQAMQPLEALLHEMDTEFQQVKTALESGSVQ